MINYGHTHHAYSPDEYETGAKWYDGKPIYQRTLYRTGSMVSDGDYAFPTPIEGVENVVDIQGIAHNTTLGAWHPVNWHYRDDCHMRCQFESPYIRFMPVGCELDMVCVTIEYTKTE